MKKELFCIISIMLALQINAQNKWSYSVTSGLDFSSPAFAETVQSYSGVEAKPRIGFSGGAEFYRSILTNFKFVTGIRYENKRYMLNSFEINDALVNENYLTVPFGLQYDYVLKDANIFFSPTIETSWKFSDRTKADNLDVKNTHDFNFFYYKLYLSGGYSFSINEKYNLFFLVSYSPALLQEQRAEFSTFRLNVGISPIK